MAASNSKNRCAQVFEIGNLLLDEFEEILDVEHVADLPAFSTEAPIVEFSTPEVPSRPQGHEALVDARELPGSRKDPAAVDDGGQSVECVVFLDQEF